MLLCKNLVEELIASTSSPSLALKFGRLWSRSIKREGDEEEERNCGTVLPQTLHHLPPRRLLQLNKHKCYVKVEDVNKWLYARTTCLIACHFKWKLVEEIRKVLPKAALKMTETCSSLPCVLAPSAGTSIILSSQTDEKCMIVMSF